MGLPNLVMQTVKELPLALETGLALALETGLALEFALVTIPRLHK